MPRRYLFDCIPLDGAILLAIELLLLLRLTVIYVDHVKSHPVLTTVVCNSLVSETSRGRRLTNKLGSISDTVAQLLTLSQARLNNKRLGKDISLDAVKRVFDLDRLARFVSYSFATAPLQYTWYSSLDQWFSISLSGLPGESSSMSVLKRLLADQFIWAPVSLLLFFAFMESIQAHGLKILMSRLRKNYWPALKAQYVIWPLVQLLNFKFVPLQFQVPLVSSVSVGWNIYLSIMLGSRR
ncbi:hypothetical protein BCR37DRAFT_343473 [Protomyces lactucae-debilis]|uniref:Uncharacterized protein n=1 Tax=Protomyces lactucae-debilis TaxID=2754530 RepID=A0A1Y2FVC1_PROLT|nr:uncharacterized protein BCR37DRAFT_343473 [Protomyces lactucae-debilis]ORY87136.1 hypothetical protein BCR37DRAFT_343473 [Protomyces lactucae-debilis]